MLPFFFADEEAIPKAYAIPNVILHLQLQAIQCVLSVDCIKIENNVTVYLFISPLEDIFLGGRDHVIYLRTLVNDYGGWEIK